MAACRPRREIPISAPAADNQGIRPAARRNKRDHSGSGTTADMTLATRLTIAMILLVTCTVAAVGLLTYWSVEQAVLPRVIDRLETHSRLLAAHLDGYVASARGDIGGHRAAAA